MPVKNLCLACMTKLGAKRTTEQLVDASQCDNVKSHPKS